MPSTKSHCVFCLFLLLWLAAWIAWSWGAAQDDAFIHLRYAINLANHGFVTYDGVHPDFGSSSLLYIGLLSLLHRLTTSPELPRAVSSAVHLLLFCGLGLVLGTHLPRRARTARLASAVLLALLVAPSAVRWLDDGMETGLVISVAMVMAWLVHDAASGSATGSWRYRLLAVIAFVAVMLRTELLLLCAAGSVILLSDSFSRRHASPSQASGRLRHPAGVALLRPPAALAVGAAAAVGVILATMHSFLPDTALAKSHGIAHWFNPIRDIAVTLGGAFSFGAGMLGLWLLTLLLVAMRRGLTRKTLLANSLCPVVLALASLRGQEIQGVRYFGWTFAFSILWNILELASARAETVSPDRCEDRGTETCGPASRRAESRSAVLLYVFAGLLVLELPVESVAMHRVLAGRSQTVRLFASQHLEVLRERRGVASDVGFIGYFSGAPICDLAGLVNGRAAARMNSKERVNACAQTQPDFMFLNSSQLHPMTAVTRLDEWKVCGEYDFTNVRTADRHYLIVRPEIADEVCRAAGRQPESMAAIFGSELVPRGAGE